MAFFYYKTRFVNEDTFTINTDCGIIYAESMVEATQYLTEEYYACVDELIISQMSGDDDEVLTTEDFDNCRREFERTHL